MDDMKEALDVIFSNPTAAVKRVSKFVFTACIVSGFLY